jgi:hypothetical protein
MLNFSEVLKEVGLIQSFNRNPHFCDPLPGSDFICLSDSRGGRRCTPRPRAKVFDPVGIFGIQARLETRGPLCH